MTTPTPESVKALADGLTKAQRVAIQKMTDGWGLAPYDGWRRSGQACTSLKRLGLAEKAAAGCRFTDAPAYRLTPLGILVRAHIGASHD